MKFLADMGLSQTTVAWLRKCGHEAMHLRELGLQKLPDEEIVRKARDDGCVVLTFDLDFGTIMAANRTSSPSVIIFRLEDARPDNVNRHLLRILEASRDSLERGAIISVGEKQFRVRTLPV